MAIALAGLLGIALDRGALRTFGSGSSQFRLIPGICFAALGALLALQARRDSIALRLFEGRRSQAICSAAGLATAVLGLIALVGILAGAYSIAAVGDVARLSLPAALCLLLYGTGAALAFPEGGVLAVLARDGATNSLVRRLLPILVGVPPLLGFLRWRGQAAGLYSTNTGVALLIFAFIAAGLVAIWVSAVVLERVERRRRVSETKLGERTELLEAVLDSAGDHAIIGTDPEGTIVLFNSGAEQMLGYSADEVVGIATPELFRDPEELARRAAELGMEPGFEALVAGARGGAIETREWTYIRKGGSRLSVNVTVSPMREPDGRLAGFIGIAQDVSALLEVEGARHEAEQQFRRSFDHALIGMQVFDLQGRYTRVNDAFCEMVGHSRESLIGLSHERITHPADSEKDEESLESMLAGEVSSCTREKRYLHADGRVVWAAIGMSIIRDERGRPMHFVGQVQDITERRSYEGQLRYMADHDHLTGLLNRRTFEHELSGHINRIERYGRKGAVLMVDLDHFKYFNDTRGHSAGDALIVRIARELQSRLRDSDVVARLGGDEFAVLLPEGSRSDAEVVAGDLLEHVRATSPGGGLGAGKGVTASIGIASFEECKGLTADEMMVSADIAMYDAKEHGRDRIAHYTTEEHSEPRIESHMRWAAEISDALAEGRFELVAQPIVPLREEGMEQLELLLRMRDRHGDLIPPGSFLYVAERIGLISQIDRWVVERAIDFLAAARRKGRDLRVEINLSGHTIGDESLLELIRSKLKAYDLPPDRLVFEVTETVAVANIARAAAFAQSLCDLGCRFALDDFGAGFGSFYYLKHLPFDYLKIDGEFVKNCAVDETDRILIASVVQIAKGMGKKTIAEYIEDAETVNTLTDLGVDFGQGYHLGRPAPVSRYLEPAEPLPEPASVPR